MNNSEAVAEKIRRLRNERENLLHELEGIKKVADSEATGLESEVSMLRKALRIEELKKLTASEATTFESPISMVDERLRIEELKKLTASKTTDFETAISMLREDLRVLRMALPPNELEEDADRKNRSIDRKKKPWWHFFR